MKTHCQVFRSFIRLFVSTFVCFCARFRQRQSQGKNDETHTNSNSRPIYTTRNFVSSFVLFYSGLCSALTRESLLDRDSSRDVFYSPWLKPSRVRKNCDWSWFSESRHCLLQKSLTLCTSALAWQSATYHRKCNGKLVQVERENDYLNVVESPNIIGSMFSMFSQYMKRNFRLTKTYYKFSKAGWKMSSFAKICKPIALLQTCGSTSYLFVKADQV